MNAVVHRNDERSSASDRDPRLAELQARMTALAASAEETADALARAERERQAITASASEIAERLGVIEQSRTFALAQAMADALRSWRGVLGFPRKAVALIRRPPARAPAVRASARAPHMAPQVSPRSRCLAVFEQYGVAAAEVYVRRCSELDPAQRSAMLMDLAKRLADYSAGESARLALKAWREQSDASTALWCAWRMFDAGNLPWASKMLAAAEQAGKPGGHRKSWWIRELPKLLRTLPELPDRRPPQARPDAPACALYLVGDAPPSSLVSSTQRADALARTFTDRGGRLIVVRLRGWGHHEYRRSTDEVVLDAFGYDSPLVDQLQRAATQLAAVIADTGATSVHAERSLLAAWVGLAAARNAGVPFLYDVEGPDVTPLDAAPHGSRLEELHGAMEDRILSAADMVMVPTTRSLAPFRAREGVAGRLLHMPAMVHAGQGAGEDARSASRAPLDLPGDAFVVGGVDDGAQAEDLLVALGELLPTRPNTHALVLSTPERARELRILAKTLGLGRNLLLRKITGTQADRCVLDASDVFWVPAGQSPQLALEAMASGLPLISAGNGPAGASGAQAARLTYDGGDAHALAAAILQLIKRRHRRAAMASAARHYALAEHGAELVAGRIFAVHAMIVSGESTARLALLGLPHVYDKDALDAALQGIHDHGGSVAIEAALEHYLDGADRRFAALCRLRAGHLLLQRGDSLQAGLQSSLAQAASSEGPVLRAAARLELQLGRLDEADRLIARLRADTPVMGPADLKLERQIQDRFALHKAVATRPSGLRVVPVPGRSVYFLHFSLPYVSVGYATRSQGLIAAMLAEGWDVRSYTRLGFPEDFKPELDGETLPEVSDVDGVRYHRLEGMGRRGNDEAAYLLAAADRYEEVLRRERPQVVHAASNYATALPALIAARRVGLPFVYEMRGFWEVTRGSRDESFMNSAKFLSMRQWEDLVAGHADRVVVITSAMRDALVERGIDRQRISIAYNSVDVEKFQPRSPDAAARQLFGIPEGVPVIGYVGSFVDYEGLDDLVEAAWLLRTQGKEFRLLLIGDGSAWEEVRQRVADRGLGDICQLPGRIGHDEVQAAYAVIDICPFPRKPWPVCEMVSPLKPFEAMAMGKPVLVSDTAALKEIVQDGTTGLTFTKGEVADLARALGRLIGDGQLRSRLGDQARIWVSEQRTWASSARSLIDAYQQSLPLDD